MTLLGEVWTFAVGTSATPLEVARMLKDNNIPGATIIPALGVWKGEVKQLVIIRVAGLTWLQARVLSRQLRSAFKQDAVYFESEGHAYLEDDR